jgi:heme a synthase
MFCLTILMSLATSRGWHQRIEAESDSAVITLKRLLNVTVLAIFIQLLLGAVMRHEEAGLAIPTFPDNFGKLIPAFDSTGIALNFAHRAWAGIVTVLVIAVFAVVRKHFPSRAFQRPALIALGLLVLQLTLGAITILSQKAETPTTLHVSGGAALLGTLFLLAVRAHHFLKARVLGVRSERTETSETTLAIQP